MVFDIVAPSMRSTKRLPQTNVRCTSCPLCPGIVAGYFGLVAFCVIPWSGRASAQDLLPNQCMASFNVKPDRGISFPGWTPGGPTAGEPLSCPAAEALRAQLFRGTGITDADLRSAVAADDALKAERDALSRRAAELRRATTGDQLRTIGQALISEVLKYRAAYTCLAAETPPGFAVCGGFVVQLAAQAYTLLKISGEGGVGTARAAAAAELDRQVTALNQAIAAGQPAHRPLSEARRLLFQTQVALCEAVRRSCL
jgi:hypothetical protein